MNNESKKLTWAVGLVAGLGVLSIAYAALSSNLNIKGTNESVNVGYVRFADTAGEDMPVEGSQPKKLKCESYGIGSTNDEYTAKLNDGDAEKTISGGIFSRDDSSTGLILSTYFGKNWAQALAKPGNLTLSAAPKEKDTITIDGAELNDYGSFIIYKLDVINNSNNDMRLKKLPEITIDSIDTGSGKAASKNIERVIYTDCDTKNFVTPCTTALTAADNGSGSYDASKKTDYNYLKANGGNTTWYLRVGFKNYDKTNNNVNGSTKFTFSVTPNWEAVMA